LNEDARERAERYIENVEGTLAHIRCIDLPATVTSSGVEKVIDTIKRYVSDTRYHIGEGKFTTALASISYAEGLLDAVRLLKIARFSWPSEELQDATLTGSNLG